MCFWTISPKMEPRFGLALEPLLLILQEPLTPLPAGLQALPEPIRLLNVRFVPVPRVGDGCPLNLELAHRSLDGRVKLPALCELLTDIQRNVQSGALYWL